VAARCLLWQLEDHRRERSGSWTSSRNLHDKVGELEAALQRIVQWSEAYPLEIFPPPDYPRARAVLEANGMTLDAISADCMRHVVEGVGKIAREALGQK